MKYSTAQGIANLGAGIEVRGRATRTEHGAEWRSHWWNDSGGKFCPEGSGLQVT